MSEQSTTTRNQLYNFPEYYDILFNRDVSSEASFIPAVFEHFCGRTLQSYLDLACGPGYYARAISRQGIDVIGLDASPEMITFARSKDTDDQGKVEWRVGDVRDFKIDQQVDLAAFLFDSIDNLLSIDDFVRHFQSVSETRWSLRHRSDASTGHADHWLWTVSLPEFTKRQGCGTRLGYQGQNGHTNANCRSSSRASCHRE